MASDPRRSGRVSPCRETDARGRPWGGVVTSAMCCVRNRAHSCLFKCGLTFCVAAADDVYAPRSPSASLLRNVRQTLPDWGHSIVIGTLW